MPLLMHTKRGNRAAAEGGAMHGKFYRVIPLYGGFYRRKKIQKNPSGDPSLRGILFFHSFVFFIAFQ